MHATRDTKVVIKCNLAGGRVMPALGIFHWSKTVLKYHSSLILAWLALCLIAPNAAGQAKSEKLKGVVVAYQQDLLAHACFDSICGGSVIVRVEGTSQSKPVYARVDFAYADNTSPYEVFIAKRRWELTVVRAEENDSPLKKFYPVIEEGTNKERESGIPMWKVIDGSEPLPYGGVLPSYKLAKNISKNIWRRT